MPEQTVVVKVDMAACPAPGCKGRRGPRKLVCLKCWRRLPPSYRDAIYATWDNGAGVGSEAYNVAVHAAFEFLKPKGTK